MSDAPTTQLAGATLRYVPPRGEREAAAPGVWFGRDDARHLYVRVAGDETGPSPAAASTLETLLATLGDVAATIDRFVAQRASITFASRPDESFPVSICGFNAGLTDITSIAVIDPDPSRARLGVFTGEPDGYVEYRVTLERGVPVHIDAIFT